MLTEINVRNFAIIDQISIPFYAGLNIISGETGAGKSILIKSLGLLMGGKSNTTDIRQGGDTAILEGAFDIAGRQDIQDKLAEMGINCDDHQLIVRRVLQKNGKGRIYLNGQLSALNDLRQIVFPLVTLSNPIDAPLIEITGQHENKNLTSSFYQLDLLDQYCNLVDKREQCRGQHQRLAILTAELAELDQQSQQREQRMDFLNFQLAEISELQLAEGEDEQLREKIRFLRQQEKWQSWFSETQEGTSVALAVLKRVKQQVPDPKYPQLGNFLSEIEQAYLLVEDCSFQLTQLQEKMAFGEENALDQLENRLSRIRKLQKKFGESISDIIDHFNKMKIELAQLANIDEVRKELVKNIKQHELALTALSQDLSRARRGGADKLAQKVNNELASLNMQGLFFAIGVAEKGEIGPHGQDDVAFLVKHGKNDEPRPLARTASGGELSRILLSLKQVIGYSRSPRTFLFDEIDTGVSGETAEKVGAKLKNLAKGQQVLCVTHLPQVACFGDHHFFIEKLPSKNSVKMQVRELSNAERINEIARLVSGEKITKASLTHARQLLHL